MDHFRRRLLNLTFFFTFFLFFVNSRKFNFKNTKCRVEDNYTGKIIHKKKSNEENMFIVATFFLSFSFPSEKNTPRDRELKNEWQMFSCRERVCACVCGVRLYVSEKFFYSNFANGKYGIASWASSLEALRNLKKKPLNSFEP